MKKKLRLTQAIMLQGTCSNAGKSLLTCALGRLLTRFGLKVAPFKAQNMSLNSYVTLTGKEMGRAQALQAYACGLKADERMNPVLLKPLGDKPTDLSIANSFLLITIPVEMTLTMFARAISVTKTVKPIMTVLSKNITVFMMAPWDSRFPQLKPSIVLSS